MILILVFAFHIKAVIKVVNGDISVSVKYLFIKINKKYILKYEESTLLTLYLVTKKGLKKVTTLPEIIKKVAKTKKTDIAFIELITVLTQSFRKNEKSVYYYIYKKINYDIVVEVKLGLDDAFLTAAGCGLLNAAAGTACAVYNSEKRTISFKTYPEFSKLFFSINADCIITLTPADIIIGYAIYKKNKRR